MENFYKNFLRIQKKTLNINKMCWKGEIGHAKNQKKLEIKETLMKTAYEKICGSLTDYIILYCEKPAIRIRKAGRGIKFAIAI